MTRIGLSEFDIAYELLLRKTRLELTSGRGIAFDEQRGGRVAKRHGFSLNKALASARSHEKRGNVDGFTGAFSACILVFPDALYRDYVIAEATFLRVANRLKSRFAEAARSGCDGSDEDAIDEAGLLLAELLIRCIEAITSYRSTLLVDLAGRRDSPPADFDDGPWESPHPLLNCASGVSEEREFYLAADFTAIERESFERDLISEFPVLGMCFSQMALASDLAGHCGRRNDAGAVRLAVAYAKRILDETSRDIHASFGPPAR